MALQEQEPAPAYSKSTIPLDELFQRLMQHDHDWLAKTLYERWVQLVEDEKPLDSLRSISKQTPIWPFDVTLSHLPDGLQVSDYVKLIRSFDWSSTPLGPMSKWSLDMRRMANMCLSDTAAAALWIGPEYAGFWNEGYAVIAGQKHPEFLGKTFPEMWSEPGVAKAFTEMLSNGMNFGISSKGDDSPFVVHRNGYNEELWASFNIVPLSDSTGGVFGCYNTVFNTTAKQLQARRLQTMVQLGQETLLATSVTGLWKAVIRSCAANESDIPFAVLYTVVDSASYGATSTESHSVSEPLIPSERKVRQWVQAGQIGLPEDFDGLPHTMDCIEATEIFSKEFRPALASHHPLVLRKSDNTFPVALDGAARSRTHGDPCDTVVLFSIAPTNKEYTFGFLLLGVNPLRKYDSGYQQFVQLLLRQCATSLASVLLIEEEMDRAHVATQERSRLSAELAETQQKMIENGARFRNMADMAPIAMFHLDEEGRVLYANKNWLDITGHSLDTGVQMSWIPLVHPDDYPLVEKEWAKLLRGSSVNFEMRWKLPYHPEVEEYFGGELIKGSTWTIASAYAEKRTDGTVKGILGCLTDISRQKWMEAFKDRRVKDLVELKRQQDNFMDLTSHEARNPLSAIMLCAESLIIAFRQLQNCTDDEIAMSRADSVAHLEGAETILACAQHQKSVLDDVLTLSKLDSGLLVICPVEMQPIQSIALALKMFDGELHKHDIKQIFTIDRSFHDLGVDWVRLDPSRLLQVLINLLTNAIKFTQAEPIRQITITLCATRDRPSNSLHGVNYIGNASNPPNATEDDVVFIGLEVIDTGRGMTADEMKRLFQKFQQASPKTHSEYGGSGLGLFISLQLTRLLGGDIGVTSTGRGSTTFAFYITARPCQAPSATKSLKDSSITSSHKPPSLDPSGAPSVPHPNVNKVATQLGNEPVTSKIHILVVEDNLVNQKVMRNQLERLKYAVTVANHGLEALEHIRRTRFCQKDGLPLDIVLMDVEMPVCNGIECARRIRSMQQSMEITKHVPIIGVTANARAEQQAAVIEAGMDSVVTKPFRLLELSAELEKLTESASLEKDLTS